MWDEGAVLESWGTAREEGAVLDSWSMAREEGAVLENWGMEREPYRRAGARQGTPEPCWRYCLNYGCGTRCWDWFC